MNNRDALALMVKHFPGGLEVVALRVGKPAETLRKEIGGNAGFKLGLDTAVLISDLCIDAKSEHCYAFVNSVSGPAGRFIELPVREMVEKQDLRQDAAVMLKEGTDVLSELTVALADEQISDNELTRIEREVADAVESLQAVLRGAQARNKASKPSLRAA